MRKSIALYTAGMLVLCFLACLTPIPIGPTLGDRDGDGFSPPADCDDQDPDISPESSEVCDGLDQDCDGKIDEGSYLVVYVDSDGDEVGAGQEFEVCEALDEHSLYGNDCDDADALTFPGAPEACDGLDNDCDERVDEGVEHDTFYEDFDGDGYGNEQVQTRSCLGPPSGYVENKEDCDDLDPGVNPEAEELCDGLDQDCSGEGPDSVYECSCEVKRLEGNSYLYCGDYLSWFNARKVCKAMDTDLLSVHSFSSNKAVASLASSYEVFIWLGLTDYVSEGDWSTWADGSAVTYTNWAPGEPNNFDNDEDCAEIGYYTDGRWNDNGCSGQHPFMCTYNGLAPE